ncbi:hypothetical protein MBANPS3_004580 [Mucor bainieri]
MFNFTHRRTTSDASDASDASNWSCESDFSKVIIVNDTTTAYIMKNSVIPGSTKDVIDRYYSN